MSAADALDRGRRSFERQAWADAYAQLLTAEAASPLEPGDLERLAMAAYLCGRHTESEDVWARGHQAYLTGGAVEAAARCAFWLAFGLMHKGERARASGWLARAGRLLDEHGRDCVERGYLLLPIAIQRVVAGDGRAGHATFGDAAAIGGRFGDADLITLARHGQGRALIRMGRTEEGVALLDEAMATVEAGAVSAIVAGDVYCSVIEACQEIYDLRRAREWTAALTRWCGSQPQLVPYRGQCLVRRAEILQLEGAWPDALEEARRACEQLGRPPGEPAAGAAYYQLAELHRLRGEFVDAENAYREASRWGRTPQPGLAQLRFAQGRLDAAVAAIRQATDEAKDPTRRSRLLPAHVDIMLAAGDVEAARSAAQELDQMAGTLDAPLLRAVAAGARGAVLLADGDPRAARGALRAAWSAWLELEAPYEAACMRVLIASACRALGDADGAAMELDGARETFQQLGAQPDLKRLDSADRRASAGRPAGLTPRELEVLRLLAAGRSNKSIAAELDISHRTVERHVGNILAKLGVDSRSAATAYAYRHDLASSLPPHHTA